MSAIEAAGTPPGDVTGAKAAGRFGPVALVAGIFVAFLALPIVTLVLRAITDGFLGSSAGASAVLSGLGLSLATTLVSVAFTVALGLPLAFVLARRSFPGKWLVEAAVDLPIVLPPAVAGLALLLVLGRRGLLGGALGQAGIEVAFTTAAVVIAQVFVSAPFFVRSARAGIAGVDRDLEDAARVDGASEPRLVWAVTIPLAAPALAAGLVMSWARALGEFGATIMFAGNVVGRTQTLPLVVYTEFQAGDLDASIAAAATLVIAALGVLVAARLFNWRRVLDVRAIA
jgi:molybdate transport system permease protein